MGEHYSGLPASWSDIVRLMRTEAERCNRLAELFDPIEARLEEQKLPTWSGAAQDAYSGVRGKQRDQARRAADAHRRAALALHRYADAVVDLTARHPDGAAGSELAALLAERGHHADDAVRTLDVATASLEELEVTLPELPAQPVPVIERPASTPEPPATIRLSLPTSTAPRLSTWDEVQHPAPGGANPDLQALSDAVLRHFQTAGGITARLEPRTRS